MMAQLVALPVLQWFFVCSYARCTHRRLSFFLLFVCLFACARAFSCSVYVYLCAWERLFRAHHVYDQLPVRVPP